MQNKINPNKWYKPREIAQNEFITSTGADVLSHYRFILREIANGRLKAQNYARGKEGMKYFRIKGSEIIRYIQENE